MEIVLNVKNIFLRFHFLYRLKLFSRIDNNNLKFIGKILDRK